MKTQRKSIARFIMRTLLAVIPPVAVAVIFFLSVDPFKAVYAYPAQEYFPDPDKFPARVSINKGVATLAAFEQNMQRGDTCNSFIFGSSISIYYDINRWKEKLRNQNSVKAMHFDSSSESIYSLRRKIDFLDSRLTQISNALIVLDPIIMANEENELPYAIDPPCLHPHDPLFRLRYLYTFFRASTNADFFKNWLPYKIDGEVHHNAHNSLFEPQPIMYASQQNEEMIPEFDRIILTNPELYYTEFPLLESPVSVSFSNPVLTPDKLEALRAISSVFKRHNTDVKIIIGPNRRKIALNPTDMDSLVAIFGNRNVSNYSATLAYKLECDTLLYDNTHYRPSFASELLDLAYPM